MTCYHIPDEKNSFDSESAFCTHSAVCNLHFVPGLQFVSGLQSVLTGIRGTNTVYFWLQLFAQHTQSTTKYLWVNQFDVFVLFRQGISGKISAQRFEIQYHLYSFLSVNLKKFLFNYWIQ